MLKTPWRPSVDVNPLFRPFSPKPSDLMMCLAWENEEGCCIGESEFKRRTRQRLTQNHWASGEMSTLQTLYKLRQYFISINLFEGISVGLETDFHHFERIDDNSLSQACAEPCCRQRLEGRWTWFRSENAEILFRKRQSRTDGENEWDFQSVRLQELKAEL